MYNVFNERIQDMKKMIVRMAMCALVVCALPMALAAQDWQTSTMQGSGSAYSSQVTPVGAQNVEPQATTTYSSPRRISGRRNDDFNETGENGVGDNGSPIGSEWALLLFAALAGGGVFLRGRKVKVEN